VLSVGVNAARLYGAFLEGKKRSDINARYQTISNTVPALTMIVAVFLTNSLLIIILLFFTTTLFIHAVLSLYTYKKFKPNNAHDPKAQRFSFHLSVMGMLSTIAEHIDKILLFQFLGPAQLALYSFATALPEQFNVIGKSLRVLIYPKISTQTFESTKKHVLRKSGLIFAVCFVMFIGYVAISPFLFNNFFPAYIEGITLSQVYALSIFLIAATPYKSILLAHSCTKELYQTKVVLIVTRLLLLALLLPLYGVWGIIASFLIARFIEALLYVYAVHIGIKKIPMTELANQKQSQEESTSLEF
jgi:O-antigen/teichoic acid export membrane protein